MVGIEGSSEALRHVVEVAVGSPEDQGVFTTCVSLLEQLSPIVWSQGVALAPGLYACRSKQLWNTYLEGGNAPLTVEAVVAWASHLSSSSIAAQRLGDALGRMTMEEIIDTATAFASISPKGWAQISLFMLHACTALVRSAATVQDSNLCLTILKDMMINGVTNLGVGDGYLMQVAREQLQKLLGDVAAPFAVEFLSYLEELLLSWRGKQPAVPEAWADEIRLTLIVCIGTVTQHLDPQDSRVSASIETLFSLLKTPSEEVQSTICSCLVPLVKMRKEQSQAMIADFTTKVLEAESYAEKRGAAYGLAGMVKGVGVISLKQFNVTDLLKEALGNKKAAGHREGSLIALECLIRVVGRLFEPYAVTFVQPLLSSLSDGNNNVRQAAGDTARVLMQQLSAHGIRQILPSLLEALEDDSQWRSQQGAAQLLGATAYCAPKVLSQCLPQVIPKLQAAAVVTHMKVSDAARQALLEVGGVIRNEEVRILSPILIKALVEPELATAEALKSLAETRFIHAIDPPSLALVVPIVRRGLRDRTILTKTTAARIVGNMATLAEVKDVVPYLPLMLPELQAVLLDPIPDIRAVVASSMGQLLRGMKDQGPESLLPWLINTARHGVSSVERNGAAQGLAEVLAALGAEAIHATVPGMLRLISEGTASEREGALFCLTFFPASLTQDFEQYLSQSLSPMLAALADERENVREAAIKAGRVLIGHYAVTSRDLLLPELERGLFHDDWRIRQASVLLIGDLLMRVTGTSESKWAASLANNEGGEEPQEDDMDDEDEDLASLDGGHVLSHKERRQKRSQTGGSGFGGSESILVALGSKLGDYRRDMLLAAIYIMRSDTRGEVRQASLNIWKQVVTNPPRVMRAILPCLLETSMNSLAATSVERQTIAGRALGDLIRKMGDKVTPSLLPALQHSIRPTEPLSSRVGACLAITEVAKALGRNGCLPHMDALIAILSMAVLDGEYSVHLAAAEAVEALRVAGGSPVLEELLPSLIAAAGSQEEEAAQLARHSLHAIIALNGSAALVVLPTLLAPPLEESQVVSLHVLSEAAGNALSSQTERILGVLAAGLGDNADNEVMISSLQKCIASVARSAAPHVAVQAVLEMSKDQTPLRRRSGASVVSVLAETKRISTESEEEGVVEAAVDMFGLLLPLLKDLDVDTRIAALAGVESIVKSGTKTAAVVLLPSLKQWLLSSDMAFADHIPAVESVPKGLGVLLPICLQGILAGSVEVRQEASVALGSLLRLASVKSLEPHLLLTMGPLIRIVSDKFPPELRTSLLANLGLLMEKGGPGVVRFLRQLQSTFIKLLGDGSRAVRRAAAQNLKLLIAQNPKLDSLVSELLACAKAHQAGQREAALQALEGVLLLVGADVPAALKQPCVEFFDSCLSDPDELVRLANSRAFAAYFKGQCLVDEQGTHTQVEMRIHEAVGEAESGIYNLHARLTLLAACLEMLPEDSMDLGRAYKFASQYLQSTDSMIRLCVVVCLRRLSLHFADPCQLTRDLAVSFTKAMDDSSADVRLESLLAVKMWVKAHPHVARDQLEVLVTSLLESVRHKNLPLKIASERALVHLLAPRTESWVLDEFLPSIPPHLAKRVEDYVERVLCKLPIGSDDEN